MSTNGSAIKDIEEARRARVYRIKPLPGSVYYFCSFVEVLPGIGEGRRKKERDVYWGEYNGDAALKGKSHGSTSACAQARAITVSNFARLVCLSVSLSAGGAKPFFTPAT
jgi:hypothetical protein